MAAGFALRIERAGGIGGAPAKSPRVAHASSESRRRPAASLCAAGVRRSCCSGQKLGVPRDRLTTLVLKGEPLHREFDDVRHVHDVPGSCLQLNELKDAVEPVRSIQARDQLSAVRPKVCSAYAISAPRSSSGKPRWSRTSCLRCARRKEEQRGDEEHRHHHCETFTAHRHSLAVRASCSQHCGHRCPTPARARGTARARLVCLPSVGTRWRDAVVDSDELPSPP